MASETSTKVIVQCGSLEKFASAIGFADTDALIARLERVGMHVSVESSAGQDESELMAQKHQEKVDTLIENGANMEQLCRIFAMDRRDIKEKITGKVEPVGIRSGREIYRIRDVAPYLVKMTAAFDFDDYFARLSSADLPPAVNKDFWAAKRGHLAFMREKGEVVPLRDVASAFSAVFKGFRTSALLFRDAAERNSVLTDSQRKLIINMTDNLLESAYESTISSFPQLRGSVGSDQGHQHSGPDDMEL